ncbi:Fur family transcriptional regulator [Caldimonas tepidiphila]|uniref:Fur family transcriptional regulator n=1 Tax=Caldimonas tepidiphila TaxID=2315841 RepID=UPI0013005629|nr:Fur family transcriptional regulator [Caldimonas tepidiphila]
MAAAAEHCRQRGVQLTALRREVLDLLWRRNGSAKAYDLQDDMRQRHGRMAPTTVYRTLEFLMEQELVHRVDAVNAFVACDIEHGHAHPAMMLVCSLCNQVTEWHDHEALAGLSARLKVQFPGFTETAVEIKGVCGDCAREQHSR